MTAQAIRAVLLAIATVVRRFDLCVRSDLIHAPVADGFVSALRMTDVAPMVLSDKLEPVSVIRGPAGPKRREGRATREARRLVSV